MSRQMFLWDEAQAEGPHLPALVRWSGADRKILVEMREYVRQAETRHDVLNSSMLAVYALACHRFAEDLHDPAWEAETQRVMRLLPQSALANPAMAAIAQAVRGEALSQTDHDALEKSLAQNSLEWWLAELARNHQLTWPRFDEQVDQKRHSAVRDAIAMVLLTYGAPLIFLLLGGLRLLQLIHSPRGGRHPVIGFSGFGRRACS